MVNMGLILEGGGMRGVYTAGVLDFFLDQKLIFKTCYAVSAGACHACSYYSHQRGRALKTAVDYLHDPRYASVRSLLISGDYFGVKMVYDEIPNQLIPFDYETFRDSQADLFAVATNCRTGRAEYLPVQDLRHDLNMIQASSSLPGMSRMVVINGAHYLDGGIADSIPLHKSLADGHEKNVVILTQHRGYLKGPNQWVPLIKLRYRRYPEFVATIKNRHLHYNASLELVGQEEQKGRSFVIQPQRPVTIGRLEKDRGKLHALYQSGYEDARSQFERLQVFINN